MNFPAITWIRTFVFTAVCAGTLGICLSLSAEECSSPQADECQSLENEECQSPNDQECLSSEAEECQSPDAVECQSPAAEECLSPGTEECPFSDASDEEQVPIQPVVQAEYDEDLLPDAYSLEDESVKPVPADEFHEVEVIRERYPNRRVKTEREVTLDANGNYVNHGAWKMWNEAGKLVAEGSYNMGEREGVWTRWHQREDSASLRQHPFNRFESPFVSQATFVDGKIHGDWIIFDANQEKCSQVTLEHGVRNGPATVWLPGGKVYRKAVYHNDVPVGDVEQLNRNGELETVASYLDGRRLVTKITYFDGTQDKKTEANYLGAKMVVTAPDDFWNAKFAEYETNGEQLRHGPWKTWYSNGQVKMEGYYRNDAELGTFSWWHPNGQKAVDGQYVDGLQHGEWSWWHANGQKASVGEFQMGAQAGLWRQWNQEGQLASQVAHDSNQVAESQLADEPSAAVGPDVEMAQKPEFPDAPWMTR